MNVSYCLECPEDNVTLPVKNDLKLIRNLWKLSRYFIHNS